MSFLATWKNDEQNRFFKLINKILLFQYTEGIFFDCSLSKLQTFLQRDWNRWRGVIGMISLIKQIVSIKETEKPPNETKIV